MVLRHALAVLVLLISAACGDASGPPPPPPPPQASPHHLAIVTQPARTMVGSTLSPAITVEVRDSIDRRIGTATTAVTINLGANPGVATLSGSTSVNAVSGTATFNDLKLDQRGRGFTLVASSGPLLPDTSSTFDVMAPLVADAVAAGSDHVCGLKLGVAMYCWGEGSSGELGDGAAVDRPFAVVVTGGLQFAKIAAGFAQTCGITGAGAAYCWGQNLDGKLGDSTYTSQSVPTAVIGGHTFSAAPTPGFFHSCGLGSTGIAYCWGGNNVGQLGDSTRDLSYIPVAAVGGLTFIALHTANFHTCGITVDHLAYCWGGNVQGGLGDSTNVERLAPGPVKGGLTFS